MLSSAAHRSWLLLLAGLLAASPGRTAPAPPCQGGATRLCLAGRFAIEASWADGGGRVHAATARPASPASGAFSFFDEAGADLVVAVHGDELRLGAVADAAFSLRVVDTVSGESWSYDSRRGRFAAAIVPLRRSTAVVPPRVTEAVLLAPARVAIGSAVADLLESAGNDSRVSHELDAGRGGPCSASATRFCLLDGRFGVRVLAGDGRRAGIASPSVDGESGIVSLDGSRGPDIAIRMVDGRALNGSFWVLAAGLGGQRAIVEVTDLVGGRVRRFALGGDAPTSRPEVDAFSAEATTVQATLDPSLAVTQQIGPRGGSIQLTDAQGTRYALAIPKAALDALTEVTLTPVTAIAGLPFSGGLLAAIHIAPEGLLPADSALLTITPAVAVTPSQQVTFAFRDPAGELFLTPPRNQATLVIPVHRFGGYGLAAGSDADLATQLLQLPSRQEDRLAQRLAGLLLTRRRAGITGPLPPTVLQLLKAEFTTTIKPLLPQIAKGLIPNYLPFTRGFVETVKDTGLVAQVKSVVASDERGGGGGGGGNAVAQTQKAQRDAAKIEWNRNLASCLAGGGGAAAIEAYHSYSKLKAVNGLGRADTAKVLNCLRFELRFDTEVKGGDNLLYEKDTVPSVSIPLDFRIDDGYFYGQAPAPFTASLTSFDCTETEVGRTSGPFKVDRLLINALTQFDEELDVLRVEAPVSYEVFPLPMVRWREVCHAITQDQFTSWWVLYGTFHLDEIAGDNRGFRSVLQPSADPRIFLERAYKRALAPFDEDSAFLLLHTPKR